MADDGHVLRPVAGPEACQVFAVDPSDPAVAETVPGWAATKGTVGIRLFLVAAVSADPADPGLNRVLAQPPRSIQYQSTWPALDALSRSDSWQRATPTRGW